MTEKKKRTKPERAVELVQAMTHAQTREFARLLHQEEPEVAGQLASYMDDYLAGLQPPRPPGERQVVVAFDKPVHVDRLTGLCHGCGRGYQVCDDLGGYGTDPGLPSNRCAKCHHDSECHNGVEAAQP